MPLTAIYGVKSLISAIIHIILTTLALQFLPSYRFYGGTMVSFSSQQALSVQLSLSCSFSPHHPQPLSILGMQISDHKV